MSEPAQEHDASRDFDFFFGKWRIHNRRLVKRLQGCDEWETFEALSEAKPLPGGIGNMDHFVPIGWRPGFVGMSLRIFSPETKKWSIYWLDNLTGGLARDTGILQPPVVGGFSNGVGIFEASDEFQGQPIIVRYTWSELTAKSARWEQSFSPDNGKTWETNWIMLCTRAAN